jgi:hypothetical protein
MGTPRWAGAAAPGSDSGSGSSSGSSSEEEEEEEELLYSSPPLHHRRRHALDESTGTALQRLKDDAVSHASPTTAKSRRAEFKRLLKCSTRYTRKIHRKRGQPRCTLHSRKPMPPPLPSP